MHYAVPIPKGSTGGVGGSGGWFPLTASHTNFRGGEWSTVAAADSKDIYNARQSISVKKFEVLGRAGIKADEIKKAQENGFRF